MMRKIAERKNTNETTVRADMIDNITNKVIFAAIMKHIANDKLWTN